MPCRISARVMVVTNRFAADCVATQFMTDASGADLISSERTLVSLLFERPMTSLHPRHNPNRHPGAFRLTGCGAWPFGALTVTPDRAAADLYRTYAGYRRFGCNELTMT